MESKKIMKIFSMALVLILCGVFGIQTDKAAGFEASGNVLKYVDEFENWEKTYLPFPDYFESDAEYFEVMEAFEEWKKAPKTDSNYPNSGGINGYFYKNGVTTGNIIIAAALFDDCTGIYKIGSYRYDFQYKIENGVIKTNDSVNVGDFVIIDDNTLDETRNPAVNGIGYFIKISGGPAEQWQRQGQDYVEWYESLPYDKQMELLNDDIAVMKELAEMEEKQKTKEAAAYAAKPITLKVDGVVVKTDSPPVVEGGRTLVPVRALVEALGYTLSWDSTVQQVNIYEQFSQELRISMWIGSKRALVSTGIYYVETEVTLDVPAKVINGRTMVPARFIAETLGCTVSWDDATKTVSIVANKG